MSEQWKLIDGYPDYEVSDHGRVRSLVPYRNAIRGLRPKILKPCRATNGYLVVNLRTRGDGKISRICTKTVHRLVAAAFVDGDKTLQVAHLDGTRDNNHFSNLKWATPKENVSHMVSHGTKCEGERHGSHKLCNRGVLAIVRMAEAGMAHIDIAYFFDLSRATVGDYLNGNSRMSATGRRKGETSC